MTAFKPPFANILFSTVSPTDKKAMDYQDADSIITNFTAIAFGEIGVLFPRKESLSFVLMRLDIRQTFKMFIYIMPLH